MIDIKSVLVTTMPVFLRNARVLLAAVEAEVDADVGAVDITGFSDARRSRAGIGVNVEHVKSEYRRLLYRIGVVLLLPASSTVCTSHIRSLLVLKTLMRALRLSSTMSSIMSSWRL